MKYDLSIIIPARNEEFLKNTIDDILKNKEGRTEVIVGLDGQWACPTINDHPDVNIVHYSESIGQRAIMNKCARLSEAKYIMKIDAHCSFDKGFDVKMMADMQDNWTAVPIMKNLWSFDWVCPEGHRRYQSPSGVCTICGKETHKEIKWIAKDNPQSTSYCFDNTPHFQYFKSYTRTPEYQEALKTGITETMSLQGSCFMMTRDKYWELKVSDEELGSWGSQGIEVACKTWLSGGRVICNHKTWYGHMFRTQGRDFGFPYKLSGNQVEEAKQKVKKMFFNKSLIPLINKFSPVPSWGEAEINGLS
jgi:glycosyltransferase involved in cell wall biosynthesis